MAVAAHPGGDVRNDTAWMDRAACAGMNLTAFYPLGDRNAVSAEAADACDVCIVQPQCLRYALDNGESGIWGGTTEEDRRALRRREQRRAREDGEAA